MNGRVTITGSNSFSGASFAPDGLEPGLEVTGLSCPNEPSPMFRPDRWHSLTNLNISIREFVEMIGAETKADFDRIVDERPAKDTAYILGSATTRKTLGAPDSVSPSKGRGRPSCG
jgi:hypothetical protein